MDTVSSTEKTTLYLHMLCFLVLILLIATALHVMYSLCISPYCHIPGPWMCKITSFFTIYHDFRRHRTGKMNEWHSKYGPVVLIAPGEVSFSGPSATREIYGATGRHPKSQYFDNFLSYYHEHRERRKLVLPSSGPVRFTPLHSSILSGLEQLLS
jgi:hypothetical protein